MTDACLCDAVHMMSVGGGQGVVGVIERVASVMELKWIING